MYVLGRQEGAKEEAKFSRSSYCERLSCTLENLRIVLRWAKTKKIRQTANCVVGLGDGARLEDCTKLGVGAFSFNQADKKL